MKKLLFLCTAGAIAFAINGANALYSACLATACSDTDTVTTISNVTNCTSKTSQCYDDEKVESCTTCNSGYTRTATTVTPTCSISSVTYYRCVSNSSGGDSGGDTNTCDGTCSDCISTGWTTVVTGYQSKVTKTCDTSTCVCSSSTSYRCAAGYYGTLSFAPCRVDMATGGTVCSGCTRCPSTGGVYGSSLAGSDVITDCYIPTGSSFVDDTGTYTYSSPCYYSE
ncbi:MAG: hypothetical protein IJX89_00090 [Alphaproteobacteria bacterium]|nr:hypothetical protein [Alphaproteobacteria bacterium]